MPNSPNPKRDTLSISQLNRQAKRLLEGNFPSVWVEGEISNLSRPSSGHWYFSLKDNSAQVRCAMFRSSNARLRFQVEAGQQVMARAKLSLYEARGDYQLIVEHMEPAGDGALAKAFEALKNKLQAEGLFDNDSKQALPEQPKSIAVVTSATGAAIRDILTVLARRFPSIKVTIFPTAVQGQNAAQEIARAINTANGLHEAGKREFDLILTGRGGGSMEDLWAFNEEVVARAIYQSGLPVVSAVGHEVDFTIADFVADIRAPTPSAAAELISPDGQEMMASFMGFEQLLTRQMLLTLDNNKQQLGWLQSRLRHPGSRLQEHSQRLDELEMRLLNGWKNQSHQQKLGLQLLGSRLQQQTPGHKIQQLKLASAGLYQRLEKQVQRLLEQQQQRLKNSMQLLDAVSPLATLDRGYAIVSDDEGQVITDAGDLSQGQTITTRFAKGTVKSKVS
ncbi:exodeoxyribonuclease VII large subunit [Oceanicoccus sagamiensis]|uniref:Exodeoxyribonuclease 7 large subunit n=1 Tax=Oceanicoccus sagamiensis TaxID=716816 RepID=A0A1X9NN66_9GAMM|nr:exodeoxyribonuclease VII large subunit [Oceanicoccus sagamiensis]ARN75333.1 exodeoxyribonuclease VII large subunit [Oceanicoccus sagamiensis]